MAAAKYAPIKPGNQFGSLTVVKEAERGLRTNGKKVRRWVCQCVCGSESSYWDARLKRGDLRSCGCLKLEAVRFAALCSVDAASGCWNWTGSISHNGYGLFKIDGGAVQAHRKSYEMNIGEIAPSLCVLHRCDNRRCVNPSHLFLGTHSDNMLDMMRKGRGASKFSASDVVTIRAAYQAGGISQRAIAAAFGVEQVTICNILQRKRWAHI